MYSPSARLHSNITLKGNTNIIIILFSLISSRGEHTPHFHSVTQFNKTNMIKSNRFDMHNRIIRLVDDTLYALKRI